MGEQQARIYNSSAWSREEINQFLNDAVLPVRLGVPSGNGAPVVCSLWFQYIDGWICCASQRTARILTLLEANPRVGFEIAGDTMPYRGVRGQGVANLSRADGPAVLSQLLERYVNDLESDFARWLDSRSQEEVAILIEPEWLTSWDFTARMARD